MNKLVTLMALTATAMFGFVSPSYVDSSPIYDGCDDVSLNGVDIKTLTADSDASYGGTVTVFLQLCTDILNNTQHRIHFDTKAGFANDADRDNDGDVDGDDFCATTSDDTFKLLKLANGATFKIGPALNAATEGADFIEWVVPYASLGVSGGDKILIWADAYRNGIQDRAPDTDGTNCSMPNVLSEVLELLVAS